MTKGELEYFLPKKRKIIKVYEDGMKCLPVTAFNGSRIPWPTSTSRSFELWGSRLAPQKLLNRPQMLAAAHQLIIVCTSLA